MSDYPIFLKLAAAPVLIIGGGKVALRKARGLADAGARITVVSPCFHPDFHAMPTVTRITQPYTPGWLCATGQPRWRLVFIATSKPDVNRQAGIDARTANILCCRCDDSGDGDFTGAATTRRGSVTLAVSTGGASPRLAASLADHLLAAVPQETFTHADLLEKWRPIIMEKVPDPLHRRQLLTFIASEDFLQTLRLHGPTAGDQLITEKIALLSAPASPLSQTENP